MSNRKWSSSARPPVSSPLVQFFKELPDSQDLDYNSLKSCLTKLKYIPLDEDDLFIVMDGLTRTLERWHKSASMIRHYIQMQHILDTHAIENQPVTTINSLMTKFRFLSHFRKSVSPETAKKLHDMIALNMHRFSPDQLSKIAPGFKRLRLMPAPELLADLEKRSFARLADMKIDNAVHHIHAMAHLGVTLGEESCDAIRRAASTYRHALDHRENAVLLWSMAVLDSRLPDRPLLPAVEARLPYGQGTMHQGANYYAHWFDIPLVQKFTTDDVEISEQELRLKNIFNQPGIEIMPETDHYFDGLMSPVDLRLRHKDLDIIVEFDGPTHFLRDLQGEYHYNGSTLFNSRLLAERFADRVIRFDYQKGVRLDMNPAYLAELFARSSLDQCAARPRGAYAAVIEDNRVQLTALAPAASCA